MYCGNSYHLMKSKHEKIFELVKVKKTLNTYHIPDEGNKWSINNDLY
jgi:hypothetical protein